MLKNTGQCKRGKGKGDFKKKITAILPSVEKNLSFLMNTPESR